MNSHVHQPKTKRYERIGSRYLHLLVIFCTLIIIGNIGIILWIQSYHPLYSSGVIIGDPSVIYYYNPESKKSIVMSLPSDTHITSSIGEYSLEALWKLDQLEKKHKRFVENAIAETTGIPIRWSLGSVGDVRVTGDGAITVYKNAFSLANLHNARWYGMSIREYLQHVIDAWFVSPVNLTTHRTKIIKTIELGDSTKTHAIDPDAFDELARGVFVLPSVSAEALHVTVYNMTDTTGLGQKIARLLATLGVRVLTITNQSYNDQSSCLLVGGKRVLDSKTAHAIIFTLGCKIIVESNLPDEATDVSSELLLYVRESNTGLW